MYREVCYIHGLQIQTMIINVLRLFRVQVMKSINLQIRNESVKQLSHQKYLFDLPYNTTIYYLTLVICLIYLIGFTNII